jgi:hypothetical protein
MHTRKQIVLNIQLDTYAYAYDRQTLSSWPRAKKALALAHDAEIVCVYA